MKKVILFLVVISTFAIAADKVIYVYKLPKAHHPNDIMYDEGKKGLKPKNTPVYGDSLGAKTINDLLQNNKVVCSSCHIANPNPDKEIKQLRASNVRSAMCLWCHDY